MKVSVEALFVGSSSYDFVGDKGDRVQGTSLMFVQQGASDSLKLRKPDAMPASELPAEMSHVALDLELSKFGPDWRVQLAGLRVLPIGKAA